MPMLYFKCECGKEHREIVPIDHSGYKQLPNGSWRFDPNAPQVPPVQHLRACECGETTVGTDDPKAVRSFLKFNFMEI